MVEMSVPIDQSSIESRTGTFIDHLRADPEIKDVLEQDPFWGSLNRSMAAIYESGQTYFKISDAIESECKSRGKDLTLTGDENKLLQETAENSVRGLYQIKNVLANQLVTLGKEETATSIPYRFGSIDPDISPAVLMQEQSILLMLNSLKPEEVVGLLIAESQDPSSPLLYLRTTLNQPEMLRRKYIPEELEKRLIRETRVSRWGEQKIKLLEVCREDLVTCLSRVGHTLDAIERNQENIAKEYGTLESSLNQRIKKAEQAKIQIIGQ